MAFSQAMEPFIQKCRCCNKPVLNSDGYPIHTKCIVRHWSKHAHGVNASRCHEFKRTNSAWKILSTD